ncbi:MAG: nucleoside phosphorylase [Desulfamplus sp.]|nr:nucleoside phosphorylase [Desulfamplus sp.]
MSFPTWSDLNDEALIPPLGARYAPDMGQAVVMISTEPDVRIAESFCSMDKVGRTHASIPFFLGRLFTLENGITIAGPYLGAPLGAMVLESLIARGVSRVVAVGWCGALSDELNVGDIIIPDGAISDEGTSRNYMEMPEDSDFPITSPSVEFSRTVAKALHENLSSHKIECRTGMIWTTDAIYRETPKKVAFFRDKGALVVEMECSAIFSVAAYRKIDLTAVLIVSDTLFKDEWEPGFRSKRFKNARRLVIDALVTGGWNLSG